jgi:hypothetical protein
MMLEPPTSRLDGTVPHHARIDVIGGAVVILIAVLVWCGAIELDLGTITDFGAGAVPDALAVILFVSGVIVLVRGIAKPAEEADRFSCAVGPSAIVVIAVVLFGLFIRGGDFGVVSTPQLGLMIVGPLTVVIAGYATPDRRMAELLAVGFGLTAAVLVVFCDVLEVAIPVFPAFMRDVIASSLGLDAAKRILYAAYGGLCGALYISFFLQGQRT